MPVVLEFLNFSLNNACLFVLSDDFLSNSLRLLTENVCEFLCFARLKNDVALECAAGVCVVVELTLKTVFDALRICIASV